MEYIDILKKKQKHYGETKASFEFAAEEYATRKLIEENESILEMGKLHIGIILRIIINNRIKELEDMIKWQNTNL